MDSIGGLLGNMFDEPENNNQASGMTVQYYDSGITVVSADKRPDCNLVGLLNQGSTCYLNSVIQTILFTPEFMNRFFTLFDTQLARDCVSNVSDFSRNTLTQLLLLFARLLLSETHAISTKELTESFGWNSAEAALDQHDVHELSIILFSAIKSLLSDSSVDNIVDKVYGGTYLNQITCEKCGYVSKTEQPFLDLDITLGQYNSLEESLAGQMEVERLTGDNQYQCEKCPEKVDAVKIYQLKTLPPILRLHLCRFYHEDFATYKDEKRFTFPRVLDMTPYLIESDTNEKKEYELLSVVIHAGVTSQRGHYFAYIRDTYGLGEWHLQEDSKSTVPPDVGVGSNEEVEDSADLMNYLRSCFKEYPILSMDYLKKKMLTERKEDWEKWSANNGDSFENLLKASDDFVVEAEKNTVEMKGAPYLRDDIWCNVPLNFKKQGGSNSSTDAQAGNNLSPSISGSSSSEQDLDFGDDCDVDIESADRVGDVDYESWSAPLRSPPSRSPVPHNNAAKLDVMLKAMEQNYMGEGEDIFLPSSTSSYHDEVNSNLPARQQQSSAAIVKCPYNSPEKEHPNTHFPTAEFPNDGPPEEVLTDGPPEHWFNFNDDRITPISASAINDMFGGETCAYMLIYRDKSLPKLPVPAVPTWLLSQIEEENEARKKERMEQNDRENLRKCTVYYGKDFHMDNGLLVMSSAHPDSLTFSLYSYDPVDKFINTVKKMLTPECPELARLLDVTKTGWAVAEKLPLVTEALVNAMAPMKSNVYMIWDGEQIGGQTPTKSLIEISVGEQNEHIARRLFFCGKPLYTCLSSMLRFDMADTEVTRIMDDEGVAHEPIDSSDLNKNLYELNLGPAACFMLKRYATEKERYTTDVIPEVKVILPSIDTPKSLFFPYVKHMLVAHLRFDVLHAFRVRLKHYLLASRLCLADDDSKFLEECEMLEDVGVQPGTTLMLTDGDAKPALQNRVVCIYDNVRELRTMSFIVDSSTRVSAVIELLKLELDVPKFPNTHYQLKYTQFERKPYLVPFANDPTLEEQRVPAITKIGLERVRYDAKSPIKFTVQVKLVLMSKIKRADEIDLKGWLESLAASVSTPTSGFMYPPQLKSPKNQDEKENDDKTKSSNDGEDDLVSLEESFECPAEYIVDDVRLEIWSRSLSLFRDVSLLRDNEQILLYVPDTVARLFKNRNIYLRNSALRKVGRLVALVCDEVVDLKPQEVFLYLRVMVTGDEGPAHLPPLGMVFRPVPIGPPSPKKRLSKRPVYSPDLLYAQVAERLGLDVDKIRLGLMKEGNRYLSIPNDRLVENSDNSSLTETPYRLKDLDTIVVKVLGLTPDDGNFSLSGEVEPPVNGSKPLNNGGDNRCPPVDGEMKPPPPPAPTRPSRPKEKSLFIRVDQPMSPIVKPDEKSK